VRRRRGHTVSTYVENPRGYGREFLVAALATVYTAFLLFAAGPTLFLLFAAGPTFLLVSFIIYAPATILFVMARREQRRQLVLAA
jgi:arginine:ornithine antiporter/lysine permease